MAKHKIGTVDKQGVFVRIRYPDPLGKEGLPRLTISADICRSGHVVAGGQSLDTVREVTTHGTPSKDWPRKRILKLLSIWERWHLNDMQAGCEHQRTLGWTSYDEHPSEPCPTCGYKYGSAWLYESLPQDVIDFIQPLAG